MKAIFTLPFICVSAVALSIKNQNFAPDPDNHVIWSDEMKLQAALPAHVPSEVQDSVMRLGSAVNNFYYEFQAFPDYIAYDLAKWTDLTMAITNAFNNATQTIVVNRPVEPEGLRSFITGITAQVVYENLSSALEHIYNVKADLKKAGIPAEAVYNTATGWDFYSNTYHKTLTKAVGTSADAKLENAAKHLKDSIGKVIDELEFEESSTLVEMVTEKTQLWSVIMKAKARLSL